MSDIKEQSVSKWNAILTCGLKCHRLKKNRVLLLGKMNAQVLQNIKSLLEHSVLNLTESSLWIIHNAVLNQRALITKWP